jgi:hypothetical protein
MISFPLVEERASVGPIGRPDPFEVGARLGGGVLRTFTGRIPILYRFDRAGGDHASPRHPE